MAIRSKLRGAISGFGEVAARAHLPGWRTRDDVGIAVVHDPLSARRHEAIRLIKSVRVYDDLGLMLDGESPDFVDIASPPAYHAESVRAALTAGANVIVEKPLCLGVSEFDELAALAAKESRVLMCVHNWKYAPAYAVARKAIEAGRLGEIRFISIDRLRSEPAGAGGSGGQWRSSAVSGGGILIDHGWHVFYLMNWLLGGDAPLAISAHLESPVDGDAEHLADLRVAFSSGCIARAHLSWRAPVRRTSAVVYGERGCLEIEGDRVTLTDRKGAVEDISVVDAADDSYHSAWFGAMAADFIRAIASGPDSPLVRQNLTEARASLALIEAARESTASGGLAVKIH
jgi:predicted dehydrogenase